MYCFENQLVELDLSRNTKLRVLSCDWNQLTALDVSRNTELGELWCTYNQLTTLNVNGVAALQNLYCWENKLTKLDMSSNTDLRRLNCSNNQLTVTDLNDIFSSLSVIYIPPTISTKKDTQVFHIWIVGNPGTSDCDINIAREKGWWVVTGL